MRLKMTNSSETNKRLHKLLYGKNPINIRAFENIGKYFQIEFSCGFSVTINGLTYYIKSVCIFDSKTCVYSNCSYLMNITGKRHNIKISSAHKELKNDIIERVNNDLNWLINTLTESNKQLQLKLKKGINRKG